jgi:cytochrome c556
MRTRTLVAALALLQACASQEPEPPQRAQLAQAVAPPRRAGPPEYLSGTARALLRSRMASHVRDMNGLVSAIMMLDYPLIGEEAERIASDASLSRPLSNDATELNAALPALFFDEQDQLRTRARALVGASRALDPFQVAQAYGQLSQACVRCHAVYRAGPKAARPMLDDHDKGGAP